MQLDLEQSGYFKTSNVSEVIPMIDVHSVCQVIAIGYRFKSATTKMQNHKII